MQAEVSNELASFVLVFCASSIYHYLLGKHWLQNEEIHRMYLIVDPKPKADLPQVTHRPKSKTHKWLLYVPEIWGELFVMWHYYSKVYHTLKGLEVLRCRIPLFFEVHSLPGT